MRKLFFVLFIILFLGLVFSSPFSFEKEKSIKEFIVFADFVGLPKEWYPKEVLVYQSFLEEQKQYKISILRNYLLKGF